MVSVNEFPISTANDIPGFKIVETKGLYKNHGDLRGRDSSKPTYGLS